MRNVYRCVCVFVYGVTRYKTNSVIDLFSFSFLPKREYVAK